MGDLVTYSTRFNIQSKGPMSQLGNTVGKKFSKCVHQTLVKHKL